MHLLPRCLISVVVAAALCWIAAADAVQPLWISHCVGGLEAEAARLIAETFSEATGIPTRVTADDQEGMYRLVLTGTAEPLPDVLMTPSKNLPFLADAGRIVPLGERLADAPWDDHIIGILDNVTYRGKRWAIPIEGNPYGLFCNLALFRDAGIQQIPDTWEETLAAAERLTADTDGDGKTDRWGYTQCAFQLPLLLFAYGCDYLDADGTDAGFDNEAALEAMRLYVRLRRLGPSVNFERGDIGMKVSVLDNLQRYAHLDYALIALPRARVKVNSFGGSAGVLSLTVIAGPQREQALSFARFWLRPEISMRWSTSTNNIPLRSSILDSLAYRRYLAAHPQVQTLVDELAYCRPRPCRRAYAEINEAFAQISNEAQDHPNLTDAELKALLAGAAARVRKALADERGE